MCACVCAQLRPDCFSFFSKVGPGLQFTRKGLIWKMGSNSILILPCLLDFFGLEPANPSLCGYGLFISPTD